MTPKILVSHVYVDKDYMPTLFFQICAKMWLIIEIIHLLSMMSPFFHKKDSSKISNGNLCLNTYAI